jgi:hypothetical protein
MRGNPEDADIRIPSGAQTGQRLVRWTDLLRSLSEFDLQANQLCGVPCKVPGRLQAPDVLRIGSLEFHQARKIGHEGVEVASDVLQIF